MNWNEFLDDAPDKVTAAILKGPHPLAEFGSDRLTWKHKDMGIQRYKGGDGRGHVSMKSGSAAVVYYDPKLAHPDYMPDNVPDEILELHSEDNVLAAFEEL